MEWGPVGGGGGGGGGAGGAKKGTCSVKRPRVIICPTVKNISTGIVAGNAKYFFRAYNR